MSANDGRDDMRATLSAIKTKVDRMATRSDYYLGFALVLGGITVIALLV